MRPPTLSLLLLSLATAGALAGQTANDLAISYQSNSSGNQIALANGGVVPFGPTLTAAQATSAIVITNRGVNSLVVQSVTATGAGFQLGGLALLPAQLGPGQEYRFSAVFAPTALADYRGALAITAAGASFGFTLQGTGVAAVFKYDLPGGTGTPEVKANDTIPFVPAQAGGIATTAGSTTLALRVSNVGTAAGSISNVTASGLAFQITDAPIFPVTLAPGQSLTLQITFSPRAIGTNAGRLRIEDAQFGLSGIGLGAQLSVTLQAGSASIPLAANGVALLPNVTVGDQLLLGIVVANTGNQAGDVTLVSLTGQGFSVQQMPALPMRLAAGDTLRLTALVTPVSSGTLNGVLQINDQSSTLRVVGNQPPPLPAVVFTNLSDAVSALQQPLFGLQLASPYPYELVGKLTLGFKPGTFADDPTVQFTSGGRSVNFRVPANSTQAVFGASDTVMGLQTGTTAGTIALTANITVGGFNLTQTFAPTVSLSLAVGPPVIRSVEIGARTAGSFQLLITGYATSRSIQRLDFKITPAAGASLSTASLSADVDSLFSAWFQSAAGLALGSQFSATLQLNVAGDSKAIDSITVSAANTQGASAGVGVKLN